MSTVPPTPNPEGAPSAGVQSASVHSASVQSAGTQPTAGQRAGGGGRHARWPPFRQTLWLVAAAFLLLLLVGDSIQLGLQYRSQLEDAESDTSVISVVLEEFTRQTVERADYRLQEAQRLLGADAFRPGTNEARVRAALAKITGQDRLLTLARVFDVQGHEQFAMRGAAQVPAPVAEALDFFGGAQGRGLFVGLPYRDGKGWNYPMTRPIRSAAGAVLGIVQAGLEPEVLERFFGSLQLSKGGVIALLRDDGRVLLRYPRDGTAAGAGLAPFPIFQGRRSQIAQGTAASEFSVQGIDRVGYYRPVEGLPLIVAVFVVKAEALRPWWGLVRQNLIVLAGVAAALVGLVLLLVRQRERVERAEAQVLAGQQRVEAITNRLPCVVFECGRDGRGLRFDFLSSGTSELFALSVPELLGDAARLRALLAPEDRAAYEQTLQQALAAGAEWHHEFRVRTAEGGLRWVRVDALPRQVHAGTPGFDSTVWDGMFLDISRQRAAEEQLRRAQNMEAMGHLTRGVAHEFNNVLAVIQGNLELLAMDSARKEEIAESAMRAADRGAALTQRLLAFARRQTLRPVASNVNQLLQELTELLKSLLGPRVQVATRLAPDAWPIRVDRGELENALIVLAVNARDAMPQGGTLTLVTENVELPPGEPGVEPGPYVTIGVTDTGAGMTPEALRHAFDPFFTTKATGAGLGLAAVYGFIKQSQGHIAIDSREGHGTTVRLHLRKRAEGAEEAAGPGASAARAP